MQAEKNLLASILCETSGDRLERFRRAVDGGITPDSFQVGELGEVFQFLLDYYRRYKVVPSKATVEVEMDIRFSTYQDEEPFQFWLDEVVKTHLLSLLYHGGRDIADKASGGQLEDALLQFNDLIQEIKAKSSGKEVKYFQALFDEVLERHDDLQRGRIEPGIPFGFPYVDAISGGIQAGDIWVVAGSSSSGKTYMLCRSALAAAQAGKRVLFVSMEMPPIQIARRGLGLLAGVGGTYFRLGKLSAYAMERVRLMIDAWRALSDPDRLVIVGGRVNLRTDEVFSMAADYNSDIVYIDGAYMLKPMDYSPAMRNWEVVKATMEELRQFALSENIPVVNSVQFAKKGEREGIEGIGYSYAIAQIASIGLAILPDEATMAQTYDDVEYKILEFIKGREGERGKIRLRYDLARSLIEEDMVLEAPPGFTLHDDFSSFRLV